MAQIILEIPDAAVERVLTAFCYRFGYDPVTFPEHGTRSAFTKSQIVRFVRRIVHQYEQQDQVADAVGALPPIAEVDVT